MLSLIIKEYISAIGIKKFCLGIAAKKQGFIQLDVPGPECLDDPLMGRCRSGRHQCRANGAVIIAELTLQAMQRSQKWLEWTTRQGVIGSSPFGLNESIKPLLLIDPFRLVRKQHCIPIKGKTQFAFTRLVNGRVGLGWPNNAGSRHPLVQRIDHILLVGGKE